jgi:periplasmic protein CpxP/Spy
MLKRVIVAAGLVAVLAGGAAVAIAHSPQGGGPGIGGPGRGGPRGGGPRGFGGDLGLRGVDLTDAQREQLRAIMESHKQEFEQARVKLRDAHRGLAEAVDAQTVDESTIRARSTVVATAMADDAILRAKVRAEVQGILTAEQLQKVQERKAEMLKRRQERRQQ